MQPITSINDSRVAAYRNLRDRTLRGESLFVAEGELVARRLLASRFDVESVLVCNELLDRITPLVPPGVPVYVGPERLLRDVVGYDFHRGVLAVGRRSEPETLEQLAARVDRGGRRTCRQGLIAHRLLDHLGIPLLYRLAGERSGHRLTDKDLSLCLGLRRTVHLS